MPITRAYVTYRLSKCMVHIPVRMHISRRYRPHSTLPHHRSASSTPPPPPPEPISSFHNRPPGGGDKRGSGSASGLGRGSPLRPSLSPSPLARFARGGWGEGDADGLGALALTLMVRENHPRYLFGDGLVSSSPGTLLQGVLLAGMGCASAQPEVYQKHSDEADKRGHRVKEAEG